MTPLATIGIIGVGVCLLLRCVLEAIERYAWRPDNEPERDEQRKHLHGSHARHRKGER